MERHKWVPLSSVHQMVTYMECTLFGRGWSESGDPTSLVQLVVWWSITRTRKVLGPHSLEFS